MNIKAFMKLNQVNIALALIAIGLIVRIVPHAPNFVPIGAIALFAGLYLPKKWAIGLPLIIMLFSDLIIGVYSWPIMAAVYLSFAATGVIGLLVRKNKNVATVLGGTIIGSIIFYLITNAAVWQFDVMYPHTLSGLMTSYTMALPFFRNSLTSDLMYAAALVGGFELVRFWLSAPRPKLATI